MSYRMDVLAGMKTRYISIRAPEWPAALSISGNILKRILFLNSESQQSAYIPQAML